MRVRAVVLMAALVVPVCAAAPATAGPAALPEGATVLEHHDSDLATLFLVASSEALTMVSQDSGPDGRLLAGTAGPMTVTDHGPRVSELWQAVGPVLFAPRTTYDPVTGDPSTTLVRWEPLTGATDEMALPVGVRYVGSTTAGWIGLAAGTLTLHGATDRVLATGIGFAGPGFATDGDHAVLATSRVGHPPALLLVDVTTGATEWIEDASASWFDHLAISPTSLAWYSTDADGHPSVNRRAVAGGPVTRYTPQTYIDDVAVVDGAVAWTTWDGTADRLVVAPDGGSPSTVALPEVGYRFAGVGSVFHVAVSGPLGTAGVYAVDPDGAASRIMTVPPARTSVMSVDLTGGAVHTAEGMWSAPTQQVWRREVGADGVLGADTVLGRRPRRGVAPRFSAARALVATDPRESPEGLAFLDRGLRTATVTDPDPDPYGGFSPPPPPQLSGPYAVLGRRIFRADGANPLTLDSPPDGVSLFGSVVAATDTRGSVVVHDLARRRSASNPLVVREPQCEFSGYCAPLLVTDGDSVAWFGTTSLVVHDLRDGTERTVSHEGQVWPRKAVADVGVIAWEETTWTGSTVYVLDTSDARSEPVAVATTSRLRDLAVDDGRIAWVTSDGDAVVAPLPFDHPRPPRLLGVLGTDFSPDGNGVEDTWRPQLDLTKPLASATLTVRRNGSVVRVLTGTAPDGSVRDVTWDGLDAAGDPAPGGVYTWTLGGEAADGEGGVRAVDGERPATGRVLLDRRGPKTRVSVPSAATAGPAGTVRVRWRPVLDPLLSTAVAYDVKVRAVTAPDDQSGRRTYAPARRWLTATTQRTALLAVPGTPGSAYQVSARTHDAVGNVGPWSPWATTTIPWDDRALTASAGWVRETDRTAYRRTLTSTTPSDGAVLSVPDAWGSSVTVVARPCATCGRLQVWVDDQLVGELDTLGTASQVVLHRTFPYDLHAVRVVVSWEEDRRVAVDAVAVGAA